MIRPGAFNGVVAYKGTYGWADTTGIKTYAKSLDTLGFFTRDGQRPGADPRRLRPCPGRSARLHAPPRIGLLPHACGGTRPSPTTGRTSRRPPAPAGRRRQGARMGDARELGDRSMHRAQPGDDQGSDPALRARNAPASPISCRPA